MLKSIAPIWNKLQHLPDPTRNGMQADGPPSRARPDSPTEADQATLGQRLAAQVATRVGSWPFLILQALVLLVWLIYNALHFTVHFDPPPYILLNLVLSFEAAFAGPVLLIAANFGALRDHAQANRIETLAHQNEHLTQQSAVLAQKLLSVEQLLAGSQQQHTQQLAELHALLRMVHACVAPTNPHEAN